MMYILLLIYFVSIVTGDDSSEAKYIDLLPEKEKEDFLETVARRIFDNFKHKNAVPERDEHTKLIEKVLKEESFNLKKVSLNTSDDSDGKGNVAGEDGNTLDLMREGKRNKRNSLKEYNNSDIVGIKRAFEETNKVKFNELSKELGLSDTEDIEVKHTNHKQTEVSNEEITTKSYVEKVETEITVKDLISKDNSSVHDGKSNHEQDEKTRKPPPLSSKPEGTRDTNKEASEIIETTKIPEQSYSLTDKINISRRNVHSEPKFNRIIGNDSIEKYTKQESVAITERTSLSTSFDVMFTELTSEEVLGENLTNTGIKPTKSEDSNVVFANTIKKILTISPKIEATEITTDFSKIDETRKAYDKLVSNFDTDNIKLDDIRDEKDNQDNKAVVDDKTLTKKTVVPAINVELDDNYFNEESTAAVVDKNQNHTYLNDLVSSKEHYERVTEKIKSANSVTETEKKDAKISEDIVKGTENSNETIIKVIKNSKDYIKKKHSIIESVVNDFNDTTLGSNINSMPQNSNVSKHDPDIVTTTTIDTMINNNKEINIEISTEKSQNKSNRITDGKHAETTMQNTTNHKITSEKSLIDEDEEIKIKNYTTIVPKIDIDKTEVNNEKVSTERINITFIYDNSAEKNLSNSAKIRPNKNVWENNTIENKEGDVVSKTYIETTTVKIETLTVATDLYKSESNDKNFRIKEDANPYINQDTIFKTNVPKSNHDSVIVDHDENKMDKISANFVNDMIKVIRASFSEPPNEKFKPLRLLDDNPKPKEYKVYKAPNKPLDQNNGDKGDKVIEENPYYVPVYNYGPEHAYYNPKNRLGPNADDDDITIIKNDGLNVESMAHDYDSIVKDNVYNENDYTKNYYENRLDSNDNNVRNDVDYDEAYNKEKELIDRMGDNKGNNIFTANESLRSRDTENTQKLKKVEYMKHLVKIYKNRNSKNGNRKRSFSRYKLNLPIVVNYPKYSDIIMNSHDYLDVDYRYPTWNKLKHAHSRKHRILRGNGNNVIITSFADNPNSDEDDTVGFSNPYSDEKYNDDETKHQESKKPYKVMYDYDYENYIKKPLQDHYGKPDSINLFESGEYVWETQDIKEKRKKKKMEDEQSHGVKNQIRKIREMMYSAGKFGFLMPKKVEEKNYSVLQDFIKNAPKMCDGEDESCVEPFILINHNRLLSKKQTDSARHSMSNSIASDYFIARTNDSVVDYVPKLPARTRMIENINIKWISDFSQIRDKEFRVDCNFCRNGVCYTCVCGGQTYKICKLDDQTLNEVDDNNHHNHDHQHPKNDNFDGVIVPIEGPLDGDHPNTFMHWDMVKNISMLPSHLDPILKSRDTQSHNEHKQNYKKPIKNYLRSRSRNDKLRPKTSTRDDDKSREDTDAKPNIIKFDSPDEFNDPVNSPHQQSDTKSDEPYNKLNTLKSIMEIIPDDVELILKVTAMLESHNSEENEGDIEEKEGDIEERKSQCLRSIESIDVESYVSVLQDMVRNEATGLVQYDWIGTSIDIQAAIFKLKEMTESVKNNEVLDQLDFKLLKYFTFLHKFSMKRQKDLRMFLPKPKYKYNRTRSEKGVYSRTWLKRRLKKFAFEVSGTDLYYFVEFLEELQFYLYDLHTALTQIAMVTSYKNQHWFKNLNELYLDNSRKNILELLLHITTARLLDLIESSLQTGLQDGFLKYVMMNEKEIEKSKNELLLIITIIEELKKTE